MISGLDGGSSRARSEHGSRLLALGAAAGPLYLLVGLLQVLAREGFDPRRHALSLLSNGDGGWVQVANFIACGALVLAGAVGCRRALRSQRAGTWGPILLGVYGLGLIGSGVFCADPGRGFPPGSEAPESPSRDGLLHFVFGGVAFYALIAACLVFAARYLRAGRRGLGWYSIGTGIGFFASFAAIATGSGAPAVIVAFYVAVAWAWIWHTVVLAELRRPSSRRGAGRRFGDGYEA